MIAVLMPMTSPRAVTSGPPELPGLSGAVCWMMFSISRPSWLRSERPSELTTPDDTVESNPSGLPMAITSWPGDSWAESPILAWASPEALTRTSARSVAGSVPASTAWPLCPSPNTTSIAVEAATTWLLVRI